MKISCLVGLENQPMWVNRSGIYRSGDRFFPVIHSDSARFITYAREWDFANRVSKEEVDQEEVN